MSYLVMSMRIHLCIGFNGNNDELSARNIAPEFQAKCAVNNRIISVENSLNAILNELNEIRDIGPKYMGSIHKLVGARNACLGNNKMEEGNQLYRVSIEGKVAMLRLYTILKFKLLALLSIKGTSSHAIAWSLQRNRGPGNHILHLRHLEYTRVNHSTRPQILNITNDILMGILVHQKSLVFVFN